MEKPHTSEVFICDICGMDGLCQAEMKTHMLLQHIEIDAVCPFCDLCNITPEEMNLHVNSVHLDTLSCTGLSGITDSSFNNQTTKEDSSSRIINYESKTVDRDHDITQETNSQMEDNLNSSASLFSDDSIIPEVDSDSKVTEVNDLFPKKSATAENNSTELVKENVASDFNDFMDMEYNCPICSFITDCGNTLNVHVNQAHFQDTPTKLNPIETAISHSGRQEKHFKHAHNHNSSDAGNSSPKEKTFVDKENEVPQNDQILKNETNTGLLFPIGASCSSERDEQVKTEFTPVKREPSIDDSSQCPYCDLELQTDVNLQFHINGCHADDDILSKKEADVLECPLCGDIFGFGSEEEKMLQIHVNSHLNSQPVLTDKKEPKTNNHDNENGSTAPLTADSQVLQIRHEQAQKYQQEKKKNPKQIKTTPQGKGSYKRTAVKNLEKAVTQGQMSMTDFYNKQQDIVHANRTGVDEGTSCTKGLIPRIEQFYRFQTRSQLSRHWLASDMDHYSGSYGDRGWGCGYRNLQMLLSCLVHIPEFQQVVFNGNLKIPSIPKLQHLIEEAWAQGYDPQGRQQLQRVVDTSKWIGATEIYATLSSLKVKCELIDFYIPTGHNKDSTHPRLFQWVKDYFKSDKGYKPPLYLQHQGHSRTIVGIEEYKDGTLKLLIFDPGTPRGQMMKFGKGNIDNNLMKTIRRTMYGLKAKQYQIVAVIGVLSDYEKQFYKLLKSTRIP